MPTAARVVAIFACSRCEEPHGVEAPRCKRCGAWRTVTTVLKTATTGKRTRSGDPSRPKSKYEKISTLNPEIDRVLGGGIPLGVAFLFSGPPGVGKSTMMLMLAGAFAQQGIDTCYATAEEQVDDLKARAERISVKQSKHLHYARVEDMDDVKRAAKKTRAQIVIIDSVSKLSGSSHDNEQLSKEIESYASKNRIGVLVVAQVTKDGKIKGTMALQHNLGGTFVFDRCMGMRVVRGIKNRHGAETVGYFEMTAAGIRAVDNPSERFLADRLPGAPGSVVAAAIDPGDDEGRARLVEVQADVGPIPLGPRSKAKRLLTGIDPHRFGQRIHIIDAAITALTGKPKLLSVRDISVNVPGGMDASETAMDLPIALAVASAALGEPIRDLVCFGELGLVGEIRRSEQTIARIEEAAMVGFRELLAPRDTSREAASDASRIQIREVRSLEDAMRESFSSLREEELRAKQKRAVPAKKKKTAAKAKLKGKKTSRKESP